MCIPGPLFLGFWWSKPVKTIMKTMKTTENWFLVVWSWFWQIMGSEKPVSVTVFAKKGEKLNQTRLSNTIDNASAIALAVSTKGHSHAKHIDIKHHYIRECVAANKIKLVHVPSGKNIADIFTKGLTRTLHLLNVIGLKLTRARN